MAEKTESTTTTTEQFEYDDAGQLIKKTTTQTISNTHEDSSEAQLG